MSYQEIIMKATGCSQPEAGKVENVIRLQHPTLDHLCRRALSRLAKTAYEVYKIDPSLGDD